MTYVDLKPHFSLNQTISTYTSHLFMWSSGLGDALLKKDNLEKNLNLLNTCFSGICLAFVCIKNFGASIGFKCRGLPLRKFNFISVRKALEFLIV